MLMRTIAYRICLFLFSCELFNLTSQRAITTAMPFTNDIVLYAFFVKALVMTITKNDFKKYSKSKTQEKPRCLCASTYEPMNHQ